MEFRCREGSALQDQIILQSYTLLQSFRQKKRRSWHIDITRFSIAVSAFWNILISFRYGKHRTENSIYVHHRKSLLKSLSKRYCSIKIIWRLLSELEQLQGIGNSVLKELRIIFLVCIGSWRGKKVLGENLPGLCKCSKRLSALERITTSLLAKLLWCISKIVLCMSHPKTIVKSMIAYCCERPQLRTRVNSMDWWKCLY